MRSLEMRIELRGFDSLNRSAPAIEIWLDLFKKNTFVHKEYIFIFIYFLILISNCMKSINSRHFKASIIIYVISRIYSPSVFGF